MAAKEDKLFWKYVTKTDTCWLWTGAKSGPMRYGWVTRRPRNMVAHRYSWELEYGPIPKGLLVLHHCDVPACVRPSHLYLGTQQDNMDDMVRRGRSNKNYGSRHGMAKLKEEDIPKIRHMYEVVQSLPIVAKHFGICKQSVLNIVNRATWNHVA